MPPNKGKLARSAAMPAKPGEVFQAAMIGNTEEIKTMVRNMIDEVEPNGRTPLMVAAMHGQSKSLELLLGFGGQPNMMDKEGNTALHDCCYDTEIRTAKLLLDYGANPNLQNKKGDTPLHLAAYHCNYNFVEFLLKHGSHTMIKNSAKQTPFEKLRSSDHSNNYRAEDAKMILDLLAGFNQKGDGILKKKVDIKPKEETMEHIAKVQGNVAAMRTQVEALVGKVENLTGTLVNMSEQLELTGDTARKFEELVRDIMKEVKLAPEFTTSREDAAKSLSKLLQMTSETFENLCQATDYNERVFFHIFTKVAAAVGKTEDLWKELARNLFEDYPIGLVDDLLSRISVNHQDDQNRTHECLIHWKVFVGTYGNKDESLKEIINKMTFEGKDALMVEFDVIMSEHEGMKMDNPTGALQYQSIVNIASRLGGDWKQLGLYLDFTNTELENIQTNNPSGEERSKRMLLQWLQREQGFNRAKLGRLSEALKRTSRADLTNMLLL